MRIRHLYILIVLLATTTGVKAQLTVKKDSSIKGTTIEVIQSYKPEIKQAPKPELTPGLPPPDTTHPVFRYEVPQQTLYYTYSSMPLRPLALGRDSNRIPFPNYVKIGGGNLSTFYLDAGIGGLKGDNYETAIHLHHLSQQGNIEFQRSSLSGIEAEGFLHREKNTWHAAINALRNQYYYYGFNHDLYQFSSDSLSQVFTGFRLNVDMQNEVNDSRKIGYHPAITASVYKDRHDASETTFGFNLPFSYSRDSLQFILGINAVLTQLNVGSVVSSGNNIFQVMPGINYHSGLLNAHLYLSPTFGRDDTYLLPDLFLGYRIPNSQFIISGGWQALLHQNTYEELSTRNPYMFNAYQIAQTRTDEVFGSLQSNIGNHLSFTGRVSWWKYRNLPLFLNDIGDQKQFRIVYDDQVNATSLQANIRYQVGNTLSVGFSGTWFGFYNNSLSRVWHEPAVRFKGDFILHPLPAMTVSAYLSVLDDIYALDHGQEVKLNGVFDLGGSIEYMFIPRVSGFLQLNNLLNNKYERWLGYYSYGFNIFGGVRVKF